ncbi:MAG TPA: hypothetical protein VL362_02860 [Patescibacteria group bacterium]|jgi:hypothetical protein|nr:hypothetical protein [Patescibacteria group bacterium]
MKAQQSQFSTITNDDVLHSRHYFQQSDIRRRGLTPYQPVGSLSGRTSRLSTRPQPIDDTQTGLSIANHNDFNAKFTSLFSGIAAHFARILHATREYMSMQLSASRQQIENLRSAHRRVFFVPLVLGALITFIALSVFAAIDYSASLGLGPSQSSKETVTGQAATKPSGTPDTAPSTKSSTPQTQTSDGTGVSGVHAGSIQSNMDTGGTADVLPAGIPGVTEPVVITVPGTDISADGKPIVITDPTDVTLN